MMRPALRTDLASLAAITMGGIAGFGLIAFVSMRSLQHEVHVAPAQAMVRVGQPARGRNDWCMRAIAQTPADKRSSLSCVHDQYGTRLVQVIRNTDGRVEVYMSRADGQGQAWLGDGAQVEIFRSNENGKVEFRRKLVP